MRFAGFCLNELQTHITGIHPVVAYLENIHISKEEMWKGRENDTYSFLVLERPAKAIFVRLPCINCFGAAAEQTNSARFIFSSAIVTA